MSFSRARVNGEPITGGAIHTKPEADGRKGGAVTRRLSSPDGLPQGRTTKRSIVVVTAAIARGSAHGGYGEA
jgi:hypothetical protein